MKIKDFVTIWGIITIGTIAFLAWLALVVAQIADRAGWLS